MGENAVNYSFKFVNNNLMQSNAGHVYIINIHIHIHMRESSEYKYRCKWNGGNECSTFQLNEISLIFAI